MKAIIKAPVEDYMGISASVAFAEGKAEAEISEAQLEYFESAGYEVTILDKDGKPKKVINERKADDDKEAETKAK